MFIRSLTILQPGTLNFQLFSNDPRLTDDRPFNVGCIHGNRPPPGSVDQVPCPSMDPFHWNGYYCVFCSPWNVLPTDCMGRDIKESNAAGFQLQRFLHCATLRAPTVSRNLAGGSKLGIRFLGNSNQYIHAGLASGIAVCEKGQQELGVLE